MWYYRMRRNDMENLDLTGHNLGNKEVISKEEMLGRIDEFEEE